MTSVDSIIIDIGGIRIMVALDDNQEEPRIKMSRSSGSVDIPSAPPSEERVVPPEPPKASTQEATTDTPPKDPMAAVHEYVRGKGTSAVAKEKHGRQGTPYKRIPPEQQKRRHALRDEKNRFFIPRPRGSEGAQPAPPPAPPREMTVREAHELYKAEMDTAVAVAMQQEAAAILTKQKAAAAAATLRTPAAKEALKKAISAVSARRKVTIEAIRARNLARFTHGWRAERNAKGQIMSRPSRPPATEPAPPQPSPSSPDKA